MDKDAKAPEEEIPAYDENDLLEKIRQNKPLNDAFVARRNVEALANDPVKLIETFKAYAIATAQYNAFEREAQDIDDPARRKKLRKKYVDQTTALLKDEATLDVEQQVQRGRQQGIEDYKRSSTQERRPDVSRGIGINTAILAIAVFAARNVALTGVIALTAVSHLAFKDAADRYAKLLERMPRQRRIFSNRVFGVMEAFNTLNQELFGEDAGEFEIPFRDPKVKEKTGIDLEKLKKEDLTAIPDRVKKALHDRLNGRNPANNERELASDILKNLKTQGEARGKAIKGIYEELKAGRIDAQKARQDLAAQRKLEQDIEASIYLLSTSMGYIFNDPKVAQTFSTVANGSFSIYKLLNSGASALTMAAGFTNITLTIAGLFSKKHPSAEQVIIEGLNRLSLELQEFRKEVQQQFRIVQQQNMAILKKLDVVLCEMRTGHVIVVQQLLEIKQDIRILMKIEEQKVRDDWVIKFQNAVDTVAESSIRRETDPTFTSEAFMAALNQKPNGPVTVFKDFLQDAATSNAFSGRFDRIQSVREVTKIIRDRHDIDSLVGLTPHVMNILGVTWPQGLRMPNPLIYNQGLDAFLATRFLTADVANEFHDIELAQVYKDTSILRQAIMEHVTADTLEKARKKYLSATSAFTDIVAKETNKYVAANGVTETAQLIGPVYTDGHRKIPPMGTIVRAIEAVGACKSEPDRVRLIHELTPGNLQNCHAVYQIEQQWIEYMQFRFTGNPGMESWAWQDKVFGDTGDNFVVGRCGSSDGTVRMEYLHSHMTRLKDRRGQEQWRVYEFDAPEIELPAKDGKKVIKIKWKLNYQNPASAFLCVGADVYNEYIQRQALKQVEAQITSGRGELFELKTARVQMENAAAIYEFVSGLYALRRGDLRSNHTWYYAPTPLDMVKALVAKFPFSRDEIEKIRDIQSEQVQFDHENRIAQKGLEIVRETHYEYSPDGQDQNKDPLPYSDAVRILMQQHAVDNADKMELQFNTIGPEAVEESMPLFDQAMDQMEALANIRSVKLPPRTLLQGNNEKIPRSIP